MTSFAMPPRQDNLNGQLLVDPNTANDLCWSLLHEVDPMSTIDGKPLFQVFCEKRKRSARTIWAGLDFLEHPLPTQPGQAWPNPRMGRDGEISDKWPGPEMWIAARLICHGPDPFAWRDEHDMDALDYAISWQNPLLLDQLLRMPNAPSIATLAKRKDPRNRNKPWLHSMAYHGATQVLRVLLHHGWDPGALDEGKLTALHWAKEALDVKVLLEGGADPLAVAAKGRTIRDHWNIMAFSGPPAGANAVANKLHHLDLASLELDREQVMAQVVPAVFDATIKSNGIHVAERVGADFSIPLHEWRMADGNSQWSLLGHVAMGMTKARKSKLVGAMKLLLKHTPGGWLQHQSTRNISDLGLVWMAMRSQGDLSYDGTKYIEELMGRLRTVEGLEPVQAQLAVWNAALALDGKQPFPGKKIDESIDLAWQRELTELAGLLGKVQPDKDITMRPTAVQAVLAQPEFLVRMTQMPGSTCLGPGLVNPLRLPVSCHPYALQALANLLHHPEARNRLPGMCAGIEELLDAGVKWDETLPGAGERIEGLAALGRESGDMGRIVARLQAMVMQQQTPGAQPTRSRMRL